MEYREIITSDGSFIDDTLDNLIKKGIVKVYDNSRAHSLWNDLLKRSGLYAPDSGIDENDLFALVKYAFDKEYKTCKDVYFYIANGSSIKEHFSTVDAVCFSELIMSVLFEYIAVYYLWAVKKDDIDVYEFCFRTALYLLDYCYRKGNLDSDEYKAEIVDMISKHCPDAAPSVISDLYWAILAYLMCHELAHIYHCHHDSQSDGKNNNHLLEYDADLSGGRIFLNLINGKYSEFDSVFHEVFNDYVYTAPEILFLFYEDAYYMGQWMYGEHQGNSHPDIRSRIDKLLELSDAPEYTFDTEEGNAVLASYWNMSDLFREEFFLKLKNGKLEEIKRKGADRILTGNGYEEAYAFDRAMCSQIRKMALDAKVSPAKAVGLWDIAIQRDAYGENKSIQTDKFLSFIWSDGTKTYSSKSVNVFFNQKAVLEAIIEFGLTLALPKDALATVRFALLILFKLYKITTLELTDDMAKLLVECHKRNAYKKAVSVSELLEATGVEPAALEKLEELACLHFTDDRDKIILDEKVFINRPLGNYLK